MIDYGSTLRGSGPAPPGYARCWNTQCPRRRTPLGRFSKAGVHYHPLVEVAEDGLRKVALDYLGLDDCRVVGVVLKGREALALVRAPRGDFSLHMMMTTGELGWQWQVTDELDAVDYYRNGGVGPAMGA